MKQTQDGRNIGINIDKLLNNVDDIRDHIKKHCATPASSLFSHWDPIVNNWARRLGTCPIAT